MLKLSRKHSEDSEQESLRSYKDDWNKEVSLLIAELIAFKQGINGRGSKFLNIPPSSIKDPLPSEISQVLNLVSSHSQEVVSKAQNIKDFQEHYSSNRRKSSSLNVESSWWGSRLQSRVTLLNKVSKAERKLRFRLLSSSQELKVDLEKLETLILSKNIENLPHAVIKLTEIFFYFIEDFGVTFKNFQNLIIESENIKTLPKEEVVKTLSFQEIFEQRTALNIVINHIKNLDSVSSQDKLNLDKYFTEFVFKSNRYDADLLKNVATDSDYKQILDLFLNLKQISEKYLGKFSSFKDLAEKLTISSEYFSLIKESNNITNYLNKKLLSIVPNSFDRIKLDSLDLIDLMKKDLNHFMNLLEKKDLDFNVFLLFAKIVNNLIMVAEKLDNLGQVVVLQNRKDKSKYLDLKDFRKLRELKNSLKQFVQ